MNAADAAIDHRTVRRAAGAIGAPDLRDTVETLRHPVEFALKKCLLSWATKLLVKFVERQQDQFWTSVRLGPAQPDLGARAME